MIGASTFPRGKRHGFTLIELSVAMLLMTLLVMFVASAWQGMGRSIVDTVQRSRITQEANLAMESLNRDLSGQLPAASLGDERLGRFVGRLAVGGSQLMLCFDGGGLNGTADWGAPDTIIVYEVQANQLIRENQTDGSSFAVADDVSGMVVTELADGVRVELTFSYRNLTRTFTIVSQDP